MRIQHIGSINPQSIDDLIKIPDVDGAFAGGTSLTSDSFARIVGGGTSSDQAMNTVRPRELAVRECVTTTKKSG